jgi:hypothetical protein
MCLVEQVVRLPMHLDPDHLQEGDMDMPRMRLKGQTQSTFIQISLPIHLVRPTILHHHQDRRYPIHNNMSTSHHLGEIHPCAIETVTSLRQE